MIHSAIARRVGRAVGALVAAVAMVTTLGVSPAHAVVGGTSTTGSAYPYYVRLNINGSLCGGSLVGNNMVLTAAHCAVLANGNPATITAYIEDQTPVPATSVTVHPLWDGDFGDGHDLALIGLSGYAASAVAPVQVGSPWDFGAYLANTPATLVGRGRLSANGASPTQLQVLHTVLRGDDYMEDIYDPWYWFSSWNAPLMIGAGSTTQTACNGDSGGPLTVVRSGVVVEVGVASFTPTGSDQCAEPAGFAELSGAQLAWVASKVPSVATNWGGCRVQSGAAGLWQVQYQYAFLPTGFTDGPNYWNIQCTLPPVQLPPTKTTPKPAPTTPTLPPYCNAKPWMAGC